MNKDFCYCNGYSCALKDNCIRYTNGKSVPVDAKDYWWMDDCGDERIGYISK